MLCSACTHKQSGVAKAGTDRSTFEEIAHAVPCNLQIVMLLRFRSVFSCIYSRHVRSEARIKGGNVARTRSKHRQRKGMVVHLRIFACIFEFYTLPIPFRGNSKCIDPLIIRRKPTLARHALGICAVALVRLFRPSENARTHVIQRGRKENHTHRVQVC